MNFLNKKLKSIFSKDISTKYKRYPHDYNKNLINSLLNEEDEQKRFIFEKIFNLTFLQCIEHIRSTKKIEELNTKRSME